MPRRLQPTSDGGGGTPRGRGRGTSRRGVEKQSYMTRDAARRLRLAKKAAKAVIAAGGTHLEAVAAAQAFGTPVGDEDDSNDDSGMSDAEDASEAEESHEISLDDLRLDHAGEQEQEQQQQQQQRQQQQQQQQESPSAVENVVEQEVQQQQEQPLPELQAHQHVQPEHLNQQRPSATAHDAVALS